MSILKDDHKQVKAEQDAVRPQASRIGTQRRDVSSSVCICGHPQEEHISSDRLDNSCQVDICECSNYATPTEEQRERSAQLGVGGTDRQDFSGSDTSTLVTQHEELRPAEKLEGDAELVKSSMQETKTDTAGVNKNAQSNNSQIQVVACVQVAMDKLDKVEADTKKKIDTVEAETKKAKSQIVQELARDLEGKIPTDEISSEITHQLHGRVSQRLILDCLDEKYKKKHRVENARKQKKEQADLAALNEPVPLNSEILVDNSGNETVEPLAQSRQSDCRAETGINPYTPKLEPSSITTAAQQEKVVNANRPQPGIGSVGQQRVCESCSTKDAKIMELEQALENLKTINYGTDNHIEAASAHNRSYNKFDNSELSEEAKKREDLRKCQILQQKYEQLQSKLQAYEKVVRTQTSIKTAKELIYRSTDGYQQFEFAVPFEPLRQHMIAAFNSNRSMNRVWFTGKFNQKTGEVVDFRIGKTIDTDATEVKKDDTSNDITRD